jgi:hypothetical protein
MAVENRLWGSVRIKGELRKLGLEVSNTTVRRYRGGSPRSVPTQGWATFFYNHAPYVREAVREEVSDRTHRFLEILRGSRSQGARTVGSASGEWWSMEMPGEYRELIEERWGKWLCRCSTCEMAPRMARDPPDLRRDVA